MCGTAARTSCWPPQSTSKERKSCENPRMEEWREEPWGPPERPARRRLAELDRHPAAAVCQTCLHGAPFTAAFPFVTPSTCEILSPPESSYSARTRARPAALLCAQQTCSPSALAWPCPRRGQSSHLFPVDSSNPSYLLHRNKCDLDPLGRNLMRYERP